MYSITLAIDDTKSRERSDYTLISGDTVRFWSPPEMGMPGREWLVCMVRSVLRRSVLLELEFKDVGNPHTIEEVLNTGNRIEIKCNDIIVGIITLVNIYTVKKEELE